MQRGSRSKDGVHRDPELKVICQAARHRSSVSGIATGPKLDSTWQCQEYFYLGQARRGATGFCGSSNLASRHFQSGAHCTLPGAADWAWAPPPGLSLPAKGYSGLSIAHDFAHIPARRAQFPSENWKLSTASSLSSSRHSHFLQRPLFINHPNPHATAPFLPLHHDRSYSPRIDTPLRACLPPRPQTIHPDPGPARSFGGPGVVK